MAQPLDLSDVVRRTGLTARALRFYEARGLVSPLRTASGRRLFGPGELERINQVVALKAAGFSLADIGRLLAAQLDALDAKAAGIAAARRILLAAKSRVDRGEPLDAATLCSLIRTGDMMMDNENWKAITDRYADPANESEWTAARAKMPEDFDQAACSAGWDDLSARIEAALPMAPQSAEARAFYAEWQALLAPFDAVATPGMRRDAGTLYDDMARWQGERKPPFSAKVWDFIKSVGACGKAGAGAA